MDTHFFEMASPFNRRNPKSLREACFRLGHNLRSSSLRLDGIGSLNQVCIVQSKRPSSLF